MRGVRSGWEQLIKRKEGSTIGVDMLTCMLQIFLRSR